MELNTENVVMKSEPDHSADSAISDLADAQLALIGGGIGDVVWG